MKSLYKKQNIGKIFNLVLLRLSYYFSALTKKPRIWGAPVAIAIEPLNYCNLQCPECFAGNGSLTRDKQLMDVNCFQKVVNQLSSKVSYLTLYFQGEPLLHPNFADLVKIANKKRIFTSTSTNGHFFSNKEKVKELVLSGLDRIIISIDGTTQDTYSKYRKGGNLQKVIEGINNLVEMKKELKSQTPFIELQFLVMGHNEHQIPEIKEMAHAWGVDKLSLKTAQIYDFEKGSELMPQNENYNRYRKGNDGLYHIKGRLKNRCWKQWCSAVITSTGDVLPCCFDKNGTFVFGNVLEKPFKEIWKGKQAKSFRQSLLKNRKGIEMCCNCTEM